LSYYSQKRADLTQVLPYGCFTTAYKNSRTLQDQSLDLPSDQGVFIGIAKHNEELFESNIARIREIQRKAIKIFMTLPESTEYSYEEYTDSFFV